MSTVASSTGTSAISSGTGLVTGFPIASTVAKLVSLDSGPLNTLTAADTTLTNQQTALEQLQADLEALGNDATALGATSTYTANSVTTNNTSALTAISTGAAAPGTYEFTPLQLAQSQQLQSSSFSSDTSAIGVGSLSFQYGGFVNPDVSLSALNGGAGVPQGSIQITDRSGKTATINLAAAQTIGDVVNDINDNGTVGVKASISGDSIVLTDTTGSTSENLQVRDVNGGTTAEALGLAGINAATSSATGSDIYYLSGDTLLSDLNDGLGIQTDNTLPDLEINLADGTQAQVDLDQLPVAGSTISGTTTAANSNASLKFTATTAGSAYLGATVSFVENPAITAGNETVSYNATTKSLVFDISSQTTANDVIAALEGNSTVSSLFTVQNAPGSDGSGIVSSGDVAVLSAPQASATTAGTNGTNAKLTVTAVNGGDAYDGVQVQFVNDPSITAGHETASYDATSKILTVDIDQGATTANDVINAINNDPTVSSLFTAAVASGSNGKGLISTSDGVTTDGGEVIEPDASGADTTVQDLLNAIDAAAPGKISASISGNQIVVQDLTTGSGTFSISDLNNSQVAAELGLDNAASGGTITGDPVLGSLNSVLLKDLNGGAGLGPLGSITLTDRSGASATVNLSNAVTLGDVINDINGAGIGITASVNSGRNGIVLTDTTGSTAGNLIVADADSTDTAEKLGIATNAATNSVDGGNLHLQFINDNTTLASLNGGAGVGAGSFTITDSGGATATVNVNSSITTVGDLIAAINNSGAAVQASIDPNGDGIQIVDLSDGTGTLSIAAASGSAASDLHLLGDASTETVDGGSHQVITGSNVVTVNITSSDTLQTLIQKINNSGLNVQATEFNNGSSSSPYQFTIFNQGAGTASELAVDTSDAPFSLSETASAENALLQFGSPGGGGAIATSSSNTFDNLIPNVSLTAAAPSTSPVTVTVAADSSTLVSAAQSFVTDYNTLVSTLGTDTAFNTVTNTGATLTGNDDALNVQTDVENLLTSVFPGLGSYTSLAQLGFSLSQSGTLSLDTATLQNAYSQDPSDVQNLFSAANTGVASQFNTLVSQLAGSNNSLLSNATTAISDQITANQTRITTLQDALNTESARLTAEFDNAELIVSQLQSNQEALSSIQTFDEINNVQTAASTAATASSADLANTASNISSGFGEA